MCAANAGTKSGRLGPALRPSSLGWLLALALTGLLGCEPAANLPRDPTLTAPATARPQFIEFYAAT